MKINYYNQECEYKLKNRLKTSALLRHCIVNEGFKCGEVSIVFCSDAYMLSINNQYLKHNYYTDIITFDYTEDGVVVGDLFISVDTVADNAEELGVDARQEMLRVIIHGVLHLCGYGDKSQKEAAIMREKENFYIDMFGNV